MPWTCLTTWTLSSFSISLARLVVLSGDARLRKFSQIPKSGMISTIKNQDTLRRPKDGYIHSYEYEYLVTFLLASIFKISTLLSQSIIHKIHCVQKLSESPVACSINLQTHSSFLSPRGPHLRSILIIHNLVKMRFLSRTI